MQKTAFLPDTVYKNLSDCKKLLTYLTNFTNNRRNSIKLLTCLAVYKNRTDCREPLTTLINFTNHRSMLTCLTNITNDWINYRKLLTCLTNFTNDRRNCRKPLTCLTNFTNDRSNCAEYRSPTRRTLQVTELTAENRLFA